MTLPQVLVLCFAVDISGILLIRTTDSYNSWGDRHVQFAFSLNSIFGETRISSRQDTGESNTYGRDHVISQLSDEVASLTQQLREKDDVIAKLTGELALREHQLLVMKAQRKVRLSAYLFVCQRPIHMHIT